MNVSRRSAIFILACLLAACGGAASKLNPLDQALESYGKDIRWNEFDDASAFIDPAQLEKQPFTDLERERLKQIQVTAYEVKRKTVNADGSIEQVVEIRLINRNTQIERVVVDHQIWRWDPAAKRFWLASGLPDFSTQ